MNPPIQPVKLKNQKGIVKVCMNLYCPVALLSDGSIFVEPTSNGHSYYADFSRFLADNKIEKVVAICANGISVSILTEDGRVYWFHGERWDRTSYAAQPFGNEFRVFRDFHKMMDEKERVEQEAQEARELAEKERREEEQRKSDRRSQGLCQHCGGVFKKGLFGMKCISCGKRKDY